MMCIIQVKIYHTETNLYSNYSSYCPSFVVSFLLLTQFVPEWSLHHVSKFDSHLLQVSSRCFFGPPVLDWDTLLVDMSPPVNLSTSPVQIVTIGTYWTHLPSFNTSYRLLDEKIHCFSWKIVKKVIKNSLSLPVMSIIFWLHHYLW